MFKIKLDNVLNPDQVALSITVDVSLELARSGTSNTDMTTVGNPIILDAVNLASTSINNVSTCATIGQPNCTMKVKFTPTNDVEANS